MTNTQTATEMERWVPELDIPTRLRLVRREFGRMRGESLTQEAMAELIGVQKATYQAWEAGNSVPRDIVATAKTISDLTGVDPAWLLGLNFEEVSTGFVRTGSRWLGFDPGWSDSQPPFGAPGCRIPSGSRRNAFSSIGDLQLVAHDGPKRNEDAGDRPFFDGVVKGESETSRDNAGLVADRLRRAPTLGVHVDKYAIGRDSDAATSAAA